MGQGTLWLVAITLFSLTCLTLTLINNDAGDCNILLYFRYSFFTFFCQSQHFLFTCQYYFIVKFIPIFNIHLSYLLTFTLWFPPSTSASQSSFSPSSSSNEHRRGRSSNGRALDSKSNGCGFKSHRPHFLLVSCSKT